MTSHIAAEAASVAKELFAFLMTFIHLTLSFDGWSSKGRDEIYTVHITTPFPWKSYLIEGIILTGSSTDAETIFDRMKDVYVLSLSCHKNTDTALLGHRPNYCKTILHGCFGHYW